MAGRDRAASPYCATTRNTHEHPGTSPSNVTNKSLEVDARWNSQVARQAHNPKVSGSNPPPAPMLTPKPQDSNLRFGRRSSYKAGRQFAPSSCADICVFAIAWQVPEDGMENVIPS